MSESVNNSIPELDSMAVVGNYLPRKCGIATFTTDLVESLSAYESNCRCRAVAINDKPDGYDYPEDVIFEINQEKRSDYRTAARFLNLQQFEVVSIQHEFGIFGGPAGSYILDLMNDLNMPVVTTLHTVLVDPTKKQKDVLEQLAEISDRLVVMSKTAVNILHTLYDIPKEMIAYIPHGIPDMPFVDPNYYKEKFGLLGRNVLLTFGLLSEDKGIEHVIRGLPEVIEKNPDLTYIVLGATHPRVLETEGETYRNRLKQLVRNLNLEDHVVFKNEFVSFDDLCEYLAAADLYITPYNNENQITSGTLAYAAGTGKAVISTPYWYAKEMLSDGRGRLVPFKNAEAMGDAITGLLEDDTERHQMRKRAYDFNRSSTWPEVASRYFEVSRDVRLHNIQRPLPSALTRNGQPPFRELKLPPFNPNHLLTLTDDTGILQHATYTVPDRNHGYCTDDNARALIVAVQARRLSHISEADADLLDRLANRYTAFLLHAYNPENGRFRNFMDYSRRWLEAAGSEDAHGRALWALGTTLSHSGKNPHSSLTSRLFMQALETAGSLDSPRAIAFSLIGIDAYLNTFTGDSSARRIGTTLAEKLFEQFNTKKTESWPWPEPILTYSNGKLPHALILAGRFLRRRDMTNMGLESLSWLFEMQTEHHHLSPIGNSGWYPRSGQKARFDQQPLEANALLEACISASEISGDDRWLKRAAVCFNWFLGYNDLSLPLFDYQSGGCRDGLESEKANQNQGAESTLAWLLSLTAMHRIRDEEKVNITGSTNNTPNKKYDKRL